MNTRDRRASVLGWGLAALLVLPEPGAIDQPDRQQIAYSYRGIEADDPAVIAPLELVLSGSSVIALRVSGTSNLMLYVSGSAVETITVSGTFDEEI